MEINSAIPIAMGLAGSPGSEARAEVPAKRSEAQAAQQEDTRSQEAASRLQVALETAAVEINLPRFGNNDLKLDVDQGTGQILGRLVDRDSGEVVAQIPNDTTLRLIQRAQELLGSLTNEVI